MNSVIEAQETFLEFCPWNWKSDRYIRVLQIRTDSHCVNGNYWPGKRCVDLEKSIDEANAKASEVYRRNRHIKLLDEQRKA